MAAPSAGDDRRLLFYGERTASLSLYLDGLPDDLAAQVSVLPPRRLATDFQLLATAGLVVFVRGFEAIWRSGLVGALDRVGVPCAWFTDDDLTALRGEQPGFAFYSEVRVQEFAARMVALIGTTPALCARLASFHREVLHWPCVLHEQMVVPPDVRVPIISRPAMHPLATRPPAMQRSAAPRIAAIGGAFRAEGLRHFVLPALDALPDAHLLLAKGLAARVGSARVLPFEPDFARFVSVWRSLEPDILVHPPARTANLPMKGPGTLLAALYLGAAPIVANEPAFDDLGVAQGVLRAESSVGSWRDALLHLAEPDVRRGHLARLLAHARIAWSPDRPRGTIETLLALAAPCGQAAHARRTAALALRWQPPASLIWRTRLQHLGMRLGGRTQ